MDTAAAATDPALNPSWSDFDALEHLFLLGVAPDPDSPDACSAEPEKAA